MRRLLKSLAFMEWDNLREIWVNYREECHQWVIQSVAVLGLVGSSDHVLPNRCQSNPNPVSEEEASQTGTGSLFLIIIYLGREV